MDWLAIFGLIAAVAFFWDRLQRTERRLALLEERQATFIAAQAAALAEKQQPAPRSERVADAPVAGAQPSPPSSAPPSDPQAEATPEEAPREEARVIGGVRIRKSEDAPASPRPSALTVGRTSTPAPTPAMALAQDDAVTTQTVDRPDEPVAPAKAFDFEDIFGRRLPIWAGGIALAVSGVFLVRYSIEAGLMTPVVRVIAAFLFGLLLLAGAEAAYRFKDRVADPRVAQALAGAGLATLYAGFYLAGTQYGLIGQTFAFIGLASVTGAAIALSYRFGLPSAVLGLVGGFAAPALVGGDEANLPLLSLYLGLVTAGLTLSGRHQQRPWMGIAALVGGLGWGFVLLLTGEFGISGVLALGLYLVALGAVIPALAGAEKLEQPLRLTAALVSAVQLALLVDQGGYAPLAWGLYLLLGAALAWYGWRQPEVRGGSAMAATVGVVLYQFWGLDVPAIDLPLPLYAAVGGGLAAIFALVPLALTWRERDQLIDRWQFTLVPAALMLVVIATFITFDDDSARPMMALASLALAAIPLAGAWLIRTRGPMRDFAFALGSGGLLAFIALTLVTPSWLAPVMAAVVVAAIAFIAHQRACDGAKGGVELANLLWVGAFAAIVTLAATPHIESESARLVGLTGEEGSRWFALIRWLAATLPLAALAWLDPRLSARRCAEALGAALLYGALAQVVPVVVLVWVTAGLAIAAMLVLADRPAIQASLATISVLWAMPPFGEWLLAGMQSLSGNPVFVDSVPDLRATLTRLLPAALALGTLRYKATPTPGIVLQARWLAVPFLLIALHGLFKQIFAIETITAFVDYGMAERTLWEALLLGAAWLAWNGLAWIGLPRIGRQRWLAATLAATALAHFVLYTGLLHNPLLTRQAVGPTPIANWILASHAVALIAVLSLRRWTGDIWQGRLRPVFDGVAMAIASVGALALLRQGFTGTVLVDTPMGQTEDLLRSLLGIVLALVFLFVGSRLGERSWRIGSLVLMVLAVIKVFLFDTAGLEGLLRIASFMALGFSLIGIGWLYSRQLRASPPPAVEAS